MSIMYKRGLFLTLILAMVVAISACGSNSTANTGGNSSGTAKSAGTSTDNSSANTSSTNTSSSNSDTTTKATKMDLGGRTVTFAAWWNDSPTQDKSASGKERVAQIKKVEKEYNVKIKYLNVPFNDFQKKFTSSVLAGQPFADFVRLGYDWAMTAAAKKQILPVKSFAPDMTKYPKLTAGANFFGNNYSLNTPFYNFAGIIYNIDVFKKLNLPDPHQLMAAGKWNWDEFEKLAKEATNKQKKTWGFSGFDQETIQFLIASNDAHMVDMKTGKVDLTDQKVVQAYDFLNKLYNVDHVVKVEPKSNADTWTERSTFKDGDVAMTYDYDWENSGDFKDINFGWVPFPKGPSATEYENPEITGGTNAYFIPKGVKNPEALVQIYNELFDVKNLEDYPGQNWFETNLKRQVDIDAAKKLSQSKYQLGYTFFDKFPQSAMTKDVIINHKSVEAVLKSYQAKAQSAVDNVLNGDSGSKASK